MAQIEDSFPVGILDAEGESKELTLSDEPLGAVTVSWTRTVTARTDSGTSDEASASLELVIETDTGSGYSTHTTRNYSASSSGGGVDSDSGSDSVEIFDLSQGDKVRIRVTERTVLELGASAEAVAEADPDKCTYEAAEEGETLTRSLSDPFDLDETVATTAERDRSPTDGFVFSEALTRGVSSAQSGEVRALVESLSFGENFVGFSVADLPPVSSALTYYGGDIAEGTRARPSLFNTRFSAMSQNLDELQSRILSEITRAAPPTSTSTGNRGEWAYDSEGVYICVSTNAWRRVPLAGY